MLIVTELSSLTHPQKIKQINPTNHQNPTNHSLDNDQVGNTHQKLSK
ncbi:MAG: hypothetical protein ACLBM3_02925 [Dolichospermum sp.]